MNWALFTVVVVVEWASGWMNEQAAESARSQEWEAARRECDDNADEGDDERQLKQIRQPAARARGFWLFAASQ